MHEYHAEVLRVVDGDTLDLRIDLGFKIETRIRVRLYGIDTPETFGVKKGSAEWKAGKQASAFASSWIAKGAKFTVRSHDGKKLGKGKYGRWIVEVHRHTNKGPDAISLNTALVAAGHAQEISY